jgi:hypothetical protein
VNDTALLGNRALRIAIRRNLVSFPSQAPIFGRFPRRETQWRIAVLYFIRGWTTRQIADRYGLSRERCGQILSEWRMRAMSMGYVQDVTPDGLDEASLLSPEPDVARDGSGAQQRSTAELPCQTRVTDPALYRKIDSSIPPRTPRFGRSTPGIS